MTWRDEGNLICLKLDIARGRAVYLGRVFERPELVFVRSLDVEA